MRDPERIGRLLNLIALYWKKHPDFRLGQILSNMQDTHRVSQGHPVNHDVFYFEDEDLIETLDKQLEFEEHLAARIK